MELEKALTPAYRGVSLSIVEGNDWYHRVHLGEINRKMIRLDLDLEPRKGAWGT